jgi:hypothetical protein
MMGIAVHPSATIRYAIAYVAAIALILPPPAHCLCCGTLVTNVASCPMASLGVQTERPCCQKHTAHHSLASTNSDGCARLQSSTCNCSIRTTDRSAVSDEQRHTDAPQSVAIFTSASRFATTSNAAYSAVTASANLPPPVPHRVLHCSWII